MSWELVIICFSANNLSLRRASAGMWGLDNKMSYWQHQTVNLLSFTPSSLQISSRQHAEGWGRSSASSSGSPPCLLGGPNCRASHTPSPSPETKVTALKVPGWWRHHPYMGMGGQLDLVISGVCRDVPVRCLTYCKWLQNPVVQSKESSSRMFFFFFFGNRLNRGNLSDLVSRDQTVLKGNIQPNHSLHKRTLHVHATAVLMGRQSCRHRPSEQTKQPSMSPQEGWHPRPGITHSPCI